MGAPTCNINPKNPPPQSKAPALPAIPIATDLVTALAAINALRQLTIQYFNQLPSPGNTTFVLNPNPNTPTGPVVRGPGSPGYPAVSGGNFAEVTASRVVTTTRIYDPNDPTQQTYVDVAQITGLQFANKAGQVINWSQGATS